MERIKVLVRKELCLDSTGHDYYHAERVARLADRLAETEQADAEICLAVGYLHDYC
ncbi:HD domain-containing protein [Enterocloster clostridioformis]|nr:HD domain-containing protein [Enterocloster bolteae]MCC3392472.1 HD domain-containing protein [Enterocloster bolteae]RGB82573.1 HD domain-containing protein [Enterocloster clostridioformis]